MQEQQHGCELFILRHSLLWRPDAGRVFRTSLLVDSNNCTGSNQKLVFRRIVSN